MQDNERLQNQLQFLLEIDKLKEVYRQSYLLNSKRRENSSEHSWHIAILAMILAEHADEKPDLFRVLCMLLIHDLVEIDAGDTYCYDQSGAQDKAKREEEAAQRLFGLLPTDQGQWLWALWTEFEEGTSPEARFAHAADRFLPLLHNYYTQGKSWLEHGISQDQVQERMARISSGSKTLWECTQNILQAAVEQGYLASDSKTG